MQNTVRDSTIETVDTICAVSTPAGQGGIGIIRLSGPCSHGILRKIFRPVQKQAVFASHRLYLGHIINPDGGRVIDEVMAVFMDAPRTYTREDVAEVHAHGGFSTGKNILSLMIDSGARLAEPGEFTKRAFFSGRIDLLQAEAVIDIINSETDEELANAMEHLGGGLSLRIRELRDAVASSLAELEALIDFPDEDIEVNEEGIFKSLKASLRQIERLIETYYRGRAVREGLEVLIIGKPNSGKSSLLNALLLKEKAIVSSIPGTTRDLIEDVIHIKGIKVRLIDTAGLRTPKDVVEEKGIARVKARIPKADLILWLLDGSTPYTAEDAMIRDHIVTKRMIAVINKMDLPQLLERDHLPPEAIEQIEVSALNDMGLDYLKDKIYGKLMEDGARRGSLLITNLRHRDTLKKAVLALERAVDGMKEGLHLEFIALEIRESLLNLGEIIGETCPDDILNMIFDRFCIGK